MPKYVITSPDGKKYEVTAPEGASQNDVLAFVMSQHQDAPAQPQAQIEEPSLMVGIGKGMNDVARGLGDLVGKPNWTGIEPYAKADEKINSSAIGSIGQVMGNMAATAPAMLIPGANSLLGSAAIGAGTSALTTEGNADKRLEAGAMGGVLGGAGSLIPYAAKLIAKTFAPFGSTKQKEAIIGRMLNKITEENAPDIIARLEGAQPLIAGSNPTAAEVANSGGIAAIQRFAAAANPEKFAHRDMENAAARYKALQDIAGDESKLQAAIQNRSLATGDDYTAIHDLMVQSSPDLERILKTDAGKQAISNARKIAENEYRQFGERMPGMMSDVEKSDFLQASAQQPNKQPSTHWTRQPVNVERDNLLTAIRKKGGINKNMAQETYGNRIWEDLPAGLFRNDGGHSLDDMITMLAEDGYVSETLMPKDLVKMLYDGADNSFSASKQSYDDVFERPMTESDFQASQMDRLISALEKQNERKNTPKPKQETSPYESFYYGKDLHNIQRSLGAMAGDINTDPVMRHSIGNVLNDYKSILERDIPGLLTVNQRYAELSKPINQMQVGQELLNKLGGALTQHGASASEMSSRYATALNDVRGNLVKNATGGIKKDLEDVMTPEQMTTLKNIAEELARKKNANDLGRGAGSNTFQNFSMNGLAEAAGIPSSVSGLLQVLPPVNMAKSLASKLYEAPEKEMRGLLADALLTPSETARLMKKGQKKTTLDKLNNKKQYGGLLGIGLTNTYQNQ
jgi:hypothetical protein